MLLMFLCRLRARHHITSNLREGSIELRQLYDLLFGVGMVPHGDSVNHLACKVDPEQVQQCLVSLIRRMIRMKLFDSSRLFEKYHRIAFDGTQIFSFRQRHCPHCLTKVIGETTIYYHLVLEAKILLGSNMAFSFMSEFIENEAEGVSKQDCETKAFFRLCERIKAAFPRLEIAVLLDGLYAQGPVFGQCDRYGWKYITTFKEGSIPTVQKEYEDLLKLQTTNSFKPKKDAGSLIDQEYKWAADIEYKDTQNKWHTVHVIECLEKQLGIERPTTFRHITNIPPTKQNVPVLSSTGRSRWKIENNGFNVQKNQDYELEHTYTKHKTGWKVFYLLLQIATIIEQLLTHSNLLDEELRKTSKSVRNLASKILEAIRNYNLDKDTYDLFVNKAFQVRIDTS
jgi:hypothetical protein